MHYTGAKCRLCRREGLKLFLKGERCSSQKCAVSRRGYAPGMHGPNNRSKLTEYGQQLREKQKAARFYGLTNKKLFRYVTKAEKKSGVVTDEEIRKILESRFDVILYRAGLAFSLSQARQFISHGIFLLNGKRTKTASIQIKAGDKFEVKPTRKNSPAFTHLAKLKTKPPRYLSVDLKNLSGQMRSSPEKNDLDDSMDISTIIEFYSR